MEITKDVTINTSKLIENSNLEINYSGKLKNSKEIYLHYGYTPNSFEYKKIKLDTNNSIVIHIEQPGFLYFFFSDELKKLDNNNYKDYQLYIKKSNLILTENSSMKELPYRFFCNKNDVYKTFYTSQLLKNTSKPQEIILPKPLNKDNSTSVPKVINGYIVEPVKKITNFNLTEALIPTEHISSISKINSKKESSIFNKILLNIPKLLGKNY